MPAEPLTVCAQRKSASSSSRSPGASSSWSSSCSMPAICSCASLMKAGRAAAMKLRSVSEVLIAPLLPASSASAPSAAQPSCSTRLGALEARLVPRSWSVRASARRSCTPAPSTTSTAEASTARVGSTLSGARHRRWRARRARRLASRRRCRCSARRGAPASARRTSWRGAGRCLRGVRSAVFRQVRSNLYGKMVVSNVSVLGTGRSGMANEGRYVAQGRSRHRPASVASKRAGATPAAIRPEPT